jgi:hypothetical protein
MSLTTTPGRISAQAAAQAQMIRDASRLTKDWLRAPQISVTKIIRRATRAVGRTPKYNTVGTQKKTYVNQGRKC